MSGPTTNIPTNDQRDLDEVVFNEILAVVGDRLINGRALLLCDAFTPVAPGPDAGELIVPFDVDGSSVLTWNVRRIMFRVQTAGGAPSVSVEGSSASGPFSPTLVGTVTLATDTNEASGVDNLGTVQSGDKLRFNVLALGTAQNWTIVVEMSR